jgi:hypothetical protein
MALIGAILLSIVLSTALGGMVIVAAIERRSASAYGAAVALRAAAEGAIVLSAAELEAASWTPLLAGGGSSHWRDPPPGFGLAAVTARLRTEAMLGGAHGADTPVWQVFVQASWAAVTGQPGQIHVVTWAADDWFEQDGRPLEDSNDRILVRALALRGEAEAWGEALCRRGEDGRIRIEHIRFW